MRAVICTLAKLALRHYRDPLSWAGILAAIGVATHHSIPPEYAADLETILGSIVGMLLLAADGRPNPNTDASTGSIAPRMQGQSSNAPAVEPGDVGSAHPVQPVGGADVRPAAGTGNTEPKPNRPGFGPY